MGGSMRDRINQSMKEAMKSGDKKRLSTLRLVNAAIKDRDIAARADESGQATGTEKISDQDILALLQKMIKQRRDSAATYRQGGREELAEGEEAEIAIIEEYLPEQMSDDEMRAAVKAALQETGCCGLKDMGKIMGVLKERFTGRMDFGRVSAMVKEGLKES
ncbi:MAG: GatB/YqeY domain-containing protein [Alphaproteobacteria bacterium]|nr:GatB/YqeY domain-containing protein [Alphaproteobacteria bacterium]